MDVGVNAPLKTAAGSKFALLMQERVATHVQNVGSLDGFEYNLAMPIIRDMAVECLHPPS